MQDIDKLPIVLKHKSGVISNYFVVKNEVGDLSLF
jgi:hypothetical protein